MRVHLDELVEEPKRRRGDLDRPCHDRSDHEVRWLIEMGRRKRIVITVGVAALVSGLGVGLWRSYDGFFSQVGNFTRLDQYSRELDSFKAARSRPR
jgi:hypothetical protein